MFMNLWKLDEQFSAKLTFSFVILLRASSGIMLISGEFKGGLWPPLLV